jgi:hypothetical protein
LISPCLQRQSDQREKEKGDLDAQRERKQGLGNRCPRILAVSEKMENNNRNRGSLPELAQALRGDEQEGKKAKGRDRQRPALLIQSTRQQGPFRSLSLTAAALRDYTDQSPKAGPLGQLLGGLLRCLSQPAENGK